MLQRVQVEIRRLGSDQWEAYRDVRLASLRDAPEAFAASYEAALAFDESDWREGFALPSWFAFVGDDPVGMVRVGHADDELPLLISMWVAPNARGSSAGTQLVRAVLVWARAVGKAGVRLQVVATNARAHSLYRRCGFVATGQADTLPDGRLEVEMEHRFAPGPLPVG